MLRVILATLESTNLAAMAHRKSWLIPHRLIPGLILAPNR